MIGLVQFFNLPPYFYVVLSYTNGSRYGIIQDNSRILFSVFFYESGAGRSQFINLS